MEYMTESALFYGPLYCTIQMAQPYALLYTAHVKFTYLLENIWKKERKYNGEEKDVIVNNFVLTIKHRGKIYFEIVIQRLKSK